MEKFFSVCRDCVAVDVHLHFAENKRYQAAELYQSATHRVDKCLKIVPESCGTAKGSPTYELFSNCLGIWSIDCLCRSEIIQVAWVGNIII